MASLKQISSWIKRDIMDGTPWIAVWKEGRSWKHFHFYPEGGDYEDGYQFSYEDQDRMLEILMADHKAIVLNGKHTNCELLEEFHDVTIEEAIEISYFSRLNQMRWFYDQWVIKD